MFCLVGPHWATFFYTYAIIIVPYGIFFATQNLARNHNTVLIGALFCFYTLLTLTLAGCSDRFACFLRARS